MLETRYTKDHEWLRAEEDGLVTVGITDFAQSHLGDLVYVQLPESGKEYAKGDEAVVIESVKAADDIAMPVAGIVVQVNASLEDAPGKVNEDPLGEGWFFKMKVTHMDELAGFMDETAYKDYISSMDE